MTTTEITIPEIEYRPRDPSTTVPIGFIGCGGVADAHLTAYRDAGYDVRAFCDIERDAATTRRDQYFPDADVYTDHHALLDRDDIAVVDIATDVGPRPALTEDAITSGVHVLSQKPFVDDIEVGKRLIRLAEENEVKVAVNQNGRWAPHFSYLRGLVKNDVLGDILSIHFDIHWNHDGADRMHEILFDFGIHWFDMISHLSRDSPEQVLATTAFSPEQNAETPLLAQAMVSFPNSQASITFDAHTRYGVRDHTYVSGTNGSVEISGPSSPWHAESSAPARWPWDVQTLTVYKKSGSFTPELSGHWNPDGWHGAMGELLCAIEEDRESINSARDNIRTLSLCFAAVESSVYQKPVEIGDVQRLSETAPDPSGR